MKDITGMIINGDKCIYYKKKLIKTFSKYDDFAFTKGTSYAKELMKMSEEKFFSIYPEFKL